MATIKHFLTMTFMLPVLISATAVWAEDISISAEISSASMAFEDKDTLKIYLRWEGESFLYQIDDFPMPSLEKFEILGSSSSVSSIIDSTVPSGEITSRTLQYILSPVDYGTGVIAPLNLTAKNQLTGKTFDLKTGPITVEIARPVPKETSESSGNLLYYIIAAVLIAAGGIIAFMFIKRRGTVEEMPPDLSYVESLKEIKKETVADRKLFYSRLYRLLLSFLEKERGLDVSGKTGEEVIRIIGKLDDDAEKANLMQWINMAQKVKYRPEAPSAGDVESTYNAVSQFFENMLQKG